MQIVIDIPEKDYKFIKEQVDKRDYPDMSTGKAIANGTPLPKKHGRLIDADKLLEEYGKYDIGFAVDGQPTIIEADKEDKV